MIVTYTNNLNTPHSNILKTTIPNKRARKPNIYLSKLHQISLTLVVFQGTVIACGWREGEAA